jgi:hypothetical protein
MASSIRPAESISWAESATLAANAAISIGKTSNTLEMRVII